MEKSFEKQYKSYSIDSKDFDVTDDGKFGWFRGYAIIWDNVDRSNEVAVKGCFSECLSENPKIKMQWQHDTSELIGSYTEVKEDDKGLYCVGRINLATARGKEAYALLKAGDIDSLSIGYTVKSDDYDRQKNVRYLRKLELYEISLVSVPCNPLATITEVKSDKVVSVDDIMNCNGNVRDIERLIKGRALSANAAKYLASMVVKSDVREGSVKPNDMIDELKRKLDALKAGIAELKDGKANPYHDDQGRFTTAENNTTGGNIGGSKPKVDISKEGMDAREFNITLSDVSKRRSNWSSDRDLQKVKVTEKPDKISIKLPNRRSSETINIEPELNDKDKITGWFVSDNGTGQQRRFQLGDENRVLEVAAEMVVDDLEDYHRRRRLANR